MPENIGTPVGNRFYTSGRMATKAVVPPYISMLRAEAAIKAVVVAAADPRVVGFPVRVSFRRKKRAPA